jgi:sorbitol-specific phosphotransferase system component IIBC
LTHRVWAFFTIWLSFSVAVTLYMLVFETSEPLADRALGFVIASIMCGFCFYKYRKRKEEK